MHACIRFPAKLGGVEVHDVEDALIGKSPVFGPLPGRTLLHDRLHATLELSSLRAKATVSDGNTRKSRVNYCIDRLKTM